jgi:hypothetical protein
MLISSRKSALLYGNNFAPFCKTMRFAIVGQQRIVPLIAPLLKRRCPATILGRVVPVVVGKTIKAMAGGRARPDVMQKCQKRVLPLGADGNAASAIARILWAVLIQASRLQPLPRKIFRAYPILAGTAMLQIVFAQAFLAQASTASRVLFAQPLGRDRGVLSTDTLTDPCRPFFGMSRRRVTIQHRQPGKRLTSQIHSESHRLPSHGGRLLTRGAAWQQV